MSNLEKVIWLGLAGYGAYSAGNAFTNQLKKVERQGVDALNLLVLLGLGATFLIRLESTAKQAEQLLA